MNITETELIKKVLCEGDKVPGGGGGEKEGYEDGMESPPQEKDEEKRVKARERQTQVTNSQTSHPSR